MTILQANFSPALGGLELYCLNLCRHLKDRGHEVILWLAEGSRMADHPIAKAFQAELFPEPFYFDPAFLWKAHKKLKQYPVSVMHLHRSRDLAATCWLSGVPRVLTLQIESTLRKRDMFHQFVYSRVDRVLTITERMRGFVLQALPTPAERVFTLHYGIEQQDSHKTISRGELQNKYDLPQGALVIGIVGRLEPPKGQDVLLQAFTKIYSDHSNVYLMITGEAPPERLGYDLQLKTLAGKLNIADRVRFTGFVNDTASIYGLLDIAVMASKEETFGLVLLEAMTAGVPLIATQAGGVPEIITDGVNGLLVPPGDVQLLADALERLIQDELLRQELSKQGRKIVAEKFSLERHLVSLEDHYRAVVGSQPQGGAG
jgi:glycosyltransferase involved in cell wall biosynthesis